MFDEQNLGDKKQIAIEMLIGYVDMESKM